MTKTGRFMTEQEFKTAQDDLAYYMRSDSRMARQFGAGAAQARKAGERARRITLAEQAGERGIVQGSRVRIHMPEYDDTPEFQGTGRVMRQMASGMFKVDVDGFGALQVDHFFLASA